MKETPIDCEQSVVAHHQATVVAQPGECALDNPASLVTTQGASVLRPRFLPVFAMRCDQFDAPPAQALPQPIAVVAPVTNQTLRLLPRSSGAVPSSYADRGQRRFREPDFARGRRTKVVSQRNTLAVDHHHPLRPLAPLGFSDSAAPFFAGAKLPSRKASLQRICCRSFSSAKKARQMLNQTSCSSQSLNRRQQVVGEGNSLGRSCQRAPLRRIHKMPSSTLRSLARGRPPRRCFFVRGSKGSIFFHCASVNSRPYRRIGPPPGAAAQLMHQVERENYCNFKALYPVLKQPLVKLLETLLAKCLRRLAASKLHHAPRYRLVSSSLHL